MKNTIQQITYRRRDGTRATATT